MKARYLPKASLQVVSKGDIKKALLRLIAGEDPSKVAEDLRPEQSAGRLSRKDFALAEIQNGKTVLDAAAAAGVSAGMVSRWMKAAGVISAQKQKEVKVKSLLDEGELNITEIANALGMSRAAVYGIKRRG